MDDHEHYFSAAPTSADERRRVLVQLAGREVEVEVAPGIFSPGGLDKGTAVLLDEAPEPPATGTFLDLGCGWGPITLSLALRSPSATVWALDVNERALDLCRDNAARLGVADRVRAVGPDQVPADAAYDEIWSNPPIRIGKAALHELLLSWLPRLTPTGKAQLVVNKNLGADTLATWLTGEGFSCTRTGTSKGFRVLEVRPRPQS
jgi:16S rRNA G1207 methylase RsmC